MGTQIVNKNLLKNLFKFSYSYEILSFGRNWTESYIRLLTTPWLIYLFALFTILIVSSADKLLSLPSTPTQVSWGRVLTEILAKYGCEINSTTRFFFVESFLLLDKQWAQRNCENIFTLFSTSNVPSYTVRKLLSFDKFSQF